MNRLICAAVRHAPSPVATDKTIAHQFGITSTATPGFGGRGYIAGTVTVDGVPSARKVMLMDRRSGVLARLTMSRSDGTYRFDYIAEGAPFTVLAIDHTAAYNAVVADNVTAVRMP